MPTNPEQPVYSPTPENVSLKLKDVIGLASLLILAGGFLYQSRAVAEDVADVKTKIEQKADASGAKAREERLAKVEQILAVQLQINAQQQEINRENKDAHKEIKDDIKAVLDAVKAKH